MFVVVVLVLYRLQHSLQYLRGNQLISVSVASDD